MSLWRISTKRYWKYKTTLLVETTLGLFIHVTTHVTYPTKYCTLQGSKCSQTVYLCLVTGRIFFHLSLPVSNLNIACFLWANFLYTHQLTTWDDFVSACFITLFAVRTEHPSILCQQQWVHQSIFSISHCTRVLLHYYALLSEFRNSLPCVLLKLPLSLAHSLLIRKWSILQTEIIQAWSVKKRERIISHICSLSHAHCKDCTSCFNRLTC